MRGAEFCNYETKNYKTFDNDLFNYMHDMRNIDNFRRALHNGLDYRDPFFLNFDKKSLKTVKTMKLPSKSKDD